MDKTQFTRRECLKLGAILAAGTALQGDATKVFAAGLRMLTTTTRVVWIQGQSCTGDSVSLLNTRAPDVVYLITKFISLVAHQTVGAAQGQTFMDVLDGVVEEEDYLLVVEGSIPMGMPEACMIGGKTLESILIKLLPAAKAVVAAGTCSAFGGIPAAEGNQTNAGSVTDLMNKYNMSTKGKLLNCPSCPTHPKSIIGTLAYVAVKGYPEVVPEFLMPTMFYGTSTHDDCPRYHYYERKIFSKYLGDPEGCLFELGCLGPISHTKCPNRQWNGGVNWCIRAASPCIGCSSQHFAKKKDFPFYRKGEHQHAVNYTEEDRGGTTK